ncbi:hypothetical protein [Streptomyces sp. NPDC005009]
MPWKIRYAPDRVPRTRPASVRTVSPVAAPAGSARRTSAGAGPERTVQASGADTSTVSIRAEAVTVTAFRWKVLRFVTAEAFLVGVGPGAHAPKMT